MCVSVRSEHGWTRLLNTPGGAQQECQQPLFSTLHAAHTHTVALPMLLLFCSVLLEFLSWTLSACPGHLALGFLPPLLSDMNHAQFATVPHTGDAIKKMRVLVKSKIRENERNRNSDT